MTYRRTTGLAITLLSAVLAATACTSGTTGQPTPSTNASSAPSSAAFPSESVPPGVEKDSVLDLNSTKDMTGVVTTVTFADSPYAAHLPDICTLIPDSAMQKLGVETKKRGFRGTQLVVQACNMQHSEGGDVQFNVTISFYINNIAEITDPSQNVTIQKDVNLTDKIKATVVKLPPSEPGDPTFKEQCGTAWGTFFGAIIVNYRTKTPERVDPCQRSIESSRIVAPLMPKSPSQMRPAP